MRLSDRRRLPLLGDQATDLGQRLLQPQEPRKRQRRSNGEAGLAGVEGRDGERIRGDVGGEVHDPYRLMRRGRLHEESSGDVEGRAACSATQFTVLGSRCVGLS